jgi:DNA-binding XRE family transcriptional regulator
LFVDCHLEVGYNSVQEVKSMKGKNFDVWLGIGLNILHYRKEQGMTQMQLAEKANISRNHMQRIETAACSCTLDTLIDIAAALKIPLNKLFEFRD